MNFPTALHRRKRDDEISLEAWLASDDPEKQALADETLAQMGRENALRYLLGIAYQEKRMRTRRYHLNLGISFIASLVVFTFLGCLLRNFSKGGWILPSCLVVNFISNMLVTYASRPSRLHNAVMEMLSQYGDISALPLLIDFWGIQSVHDKAIIQGITRLLPQLTPASASLLSQRQWVRLDCMIPPRGGCDVLDLDETFDLIRAYLVASAQTVHIRSLKYVRYYAEGKSSEPRAHDLQQIAQSYLPRLENAANRQKVAVRR